MVSIADFAFEPAQLTIGAGQPVTWSSDDGAPHGVRFANGLAGQDLMLPGRSFVQTFAPPPRCLRVRVRRAPVLDGARHGALKRSSARR